MPTVTRSTSATASSDGARRLAGIAAAIVVVGLARGAGADPPKAGHTEPDCPTASEEGQRARDRGKLLEARELFRICSKATCPGVVKKDCTKWLGELEESVPSIVIAARDASSGADLTNVRVVVDGQEVATRTDGKAIPIDPGEHSLRFEAPNLPPKTETVVIRTGEKNRLFKVELGTAPKPAPPPAAAPIGPPPAKAPEPASSSPPVLGYVLGGVGVLAIGGFAVLGATSKSDLDGLKTSCAPYCAQSDLDSVKSRMLVADILLGTGAVALVVGAVLILTHGSGSAARVTAARGR
ncbi:MAG: hypothetical protein JST00_21825 [Deltaproteobacteria bacterium]|nr:hypothetical protein [Deltaproteobacteria bacterium]